MPKNNKADCFIELHPKLPIVYTRSSPKEITSPDLNGLTGNISSDAVANCDRILCHSIGVSNI
jgi:hypothetical protein